MSQPPYGGQPPGFPGQQPPYGQPTPGQQPGPYWNPSPGYPGQQPYGEPTPRYPREPAVETPQPYQPQPGYAGGGFQPEPPRRDRGPLLAGVIIGLGLVIAALGVFIYLNVLAPNRDQATVQETTTMAPAPTAQATTGAPAPATVTVTQAPPPPATTVTAPPPATTVTAPAPTTAAWPPPNALTCDNSDYIAVNDVTSCSFAWQVHDMYYSRGPGTYDVWSPVTDRYHTMTCAAQTANIVYCSGGTNAEVWFRQ